MLALARADAAELRPEPADLVALVRELTRAWWPRAREAAIDLGFEADLEHLSVPVHRALLEEALANLLHNALRYTPAGSRVTVSVAQEGHHALLGVLDDGLGLAADELERASERFFRGRHAGSGGSGLGLSIARAVAERHGGTLTLHPGPGGSGLAVSLRLPLAHDRLNTGFP